MSQPHPGDAAPPFHDTRLQHRHAFSRETCHYGDHDPSQLAKTDEAIYGIDTDTNPARLHEHAAFAEAAGSDSQKRELVPPTRGTRGIQ